MAATWRVQPDPDGHRRVVVDGDLDLADEQSLVSDVDGLLAAEDTDVLVDFSDVAFMDSSGVRAILRLLQAHPDRIRFVAASAAVTRVLLIAGIGDVLETQGAHGR